MCVYLCVFIYYDTHSTDWVHAVVYRMAVAPVFHRNQPFACSPFCQVDVSLLVLQSLMIAITSSTESAVCGPNAGK